MPTETETPITFVFIRGNQRELIGIINPDCKTTNVVAQQFLKDLIAAAKQYQFNFSTLKQLRIYTTSENYFTFMMLFDKKNIPIEITLASTIFPAVVAGHDSGFMIIADRQIR